MYLKLCRLGHSRRLLPGVVIGCALGIFLGVSLLGKPRLTDTKHKLRTQKRIFDLSPLSRHHHSFISKEKEDHHSFIPAEKVDHHSSIPAEKNDHHSSIPAEKKDNHSSIPTKEEYHHPLIPAKKEDHRPFIPTTKEEMPRRKPADLPTEFLIEEADYCSHRHPNLFIIAYVHSAISDIKDRMMTRSTWGSSGKYNIVRIGVVFMVGRSKNEEEEKIVREESSQYHDIVQGNYTDEYFLLSYKALSALVWITRNCAHVPWTVHSDDDALIDVFRLNKLLLSDYLPKKRFLCTLGFGTFVRRKGKWAISKEEYPGTTFPWFCAGAFWILDTPSLEDLLKAAAVEPLIWIDDVYLTGLVAKRAGIRHSKRLAKHVSRVKMTQRHFGNKVAWFHVEGDLMDWWSQILRYHGLLHLVYDKRQTH